MNGNTTQSNIYLIGYRATGKTTVGKQLARILNRRFIDTDQYIEEKAKLPISEIVSRFGWEEFRTKEKTAIAEISQMNNLVVSTGGGAILDPQNTQTLRHTGTIICLHASIDTIIARLNTDPQTPTLRPSLTNNTASPTDEIHQTLTHRQPLYHQAAHIHIPTDNQTIPTIIHQILSALNPP